MIMDHDLCKVQTNFLYIIKKKQNNQWVNTQKCWFLFMTAHLICKQLTLYEFWVIATETVEVKAKDCCLLGIMPCCTVTSQDNARVDESANIMTYEVAETWNF